MHNAAPLPAGLLHLTESVDGSIIAMHSISHKIFFLPNRQLNLGACFSHLLFALCFYEFELNTAVKIICYLICVSVGIKADVFFLLMRKWANQYWQTPCLNISEHLNISSWYSQHCKWASKQTKHTNQYWQTSSLNVSISQHCAKANHYWQLTACLKSKDHTIESVQTNIDRPSASTL